MLIFLNYNSKKNFFRILRIDKERSKKYMITSIRSINSTNTNNIQLQNKNNKCMNLYSSTPCDSVTFSGKANKLSNESLELIQNFANKLKLNKVYKFDYPNVEKFNMTSIKSQTNPETRTFILQYSGYSKDNMAKYIMCAINDSGEIFENGTPIKNQEEINIYEKILPELINRASKELKIKV